MIIILMTVSLAIIVPLAVIIGMCCWLWKKGPRGRMSVFGVFCVAALSVFSLVHHEKARNARDEKLRASIENELRSRLPRGSSYERVGVVFKELKLSGGANAAFLAYLTADIPLETRGFDSPFIRVQVRVNSLRRVDGIEAKIIYRSF